MADETGERPVSLETPVCNERLVLLILAAVQFTTIVDFMIVMPLGPQLMRLLEIGPTAFGLIVSSYTLAAGMAGLVASATVDRFGRRAAFITLYSGFLLGTLLCGLSQNYPTLVLARVVTGAFGGILGGIAMAIIGDVFPENRRGRATGSMMTGFALASIAGVPLGLMIGTGFGWHVTFIALAVAGLPILAAAPLALPRLDEHVGKRTVHPLRSLQMTFMHPNHLKAFALIFAITLSGFMVFPYISAYFVGNVGFTEQQLPLVYIAGGALTLIASPIVGRLADQYGKLRVFRLIAPASAVLLCVITQLPAGSIVLAIVVFGSMMVSNVGRMIPAMAMVTSSVEPRYRGAFLSANSSVQHITGGLGSFLGGLIIVQAADGKALERFHLVGWLAAAIALTSLWLAGRLKMAESETVSAAAISLPAAAEATVDAGEPLAACVESECD